ncbi:methylated-DNA--[protein]-cysteine S-methyltransferase [Psychrobacter sp. M13]|uniref:methylated-DNA--[protein]-cysteine S-methyltransferase n=1 Tax=Psychrobacter sp. M13 TaxID=3067275 RepID=UPI00273BF8AC|nr:methylated-DNA--[protein]-cysteine S-methyltransferase [Psychrobacter sp. M13]WLP95586.1 methylated-DNA--[protein]-cysteine S-methyltransferase [Psychrobacter sp. M13]
MIVTTTKLQTYILVVMAHDIGGCKDEQVQPKLAEVSWLAKDQWWTDSKSFTKLKKYYNLTDADFKFIDKNSLNIDDPVQALLIEALIQIDEYAQEKRECFDLPLDLSLGTEFQQKVWRGLQDISFGETISYATLAERIDNPKGFRAVANANSKNPFSLIIPCHRVIASDGKLGGYTGGLDKKEYLLALEGVKCKP